MNVYKVGEAVNLKAVFEVDGVDTDPASIVLTIVDPDGNRVTPTVIKDSTGHYHYNFSLVAATPGVYVYNWASTSPAQAVKDGEFFVESTAV